MRAVVMLLALCAASPALAQLSLPQGIPGMGGGAVAPDSGSAFCQRVGRAVLSCRAGGVGLMDLAGLGTCLLRTLPAQDSLRVAQAAQRAQGSPASVLTECGLR